MIKVRLGVHAGMAPRRRRWAATAGVAMVGTLLTACGPAHPAALARPTASAGAPASGTADCDSVTTCYTPHQLQVAYGIRPLLAHGINGTRRDRGPA